MTNLQATATIAAMHVWILLSVFRGLCGMPPAPDEAGSLHAIYLGVVQIDHRARGVDAEVQIKVFTDDLQSALRNAFPDYRIVSEEDCCDQNGRLIAAYFDRHFTCSVNGRALKLQMLSCRKVNDVFALSFSMPCPAGWKTLRLEADFLMELFPAQSNVVSVLHGEDTRFFRATKKSPYCETAY